MSLRRFLAIFVLFALAVAPAGRMGIAEARTAPDHVSAMAMHCGGQPNSNQDEGDRASVDCMIACAAMAPPATSELVSPRLRGPDPTMAALPDPRGVRPEAEPPPPRFA